MTYNMGTILNRPLVLLKVNMNAVILCHIKENWEVRLWLISVWCRIDSRYYAVSALSPWPRTTDESVSVNGSSVI